MKRYSLTHLILLCNALGILLTCFFSYTAIGDNLEHLHASYLISLGEKPYLTFFEHHHPLLWYLWAPVIYYLPHNAVFMLFSAKVFALICSFLTLYFLQKIIYSFLGNKQLFLHFVLILLLFYPVWYSISLFKPDVFARLFYFWGLYLFFSYIKKQQRQILALSSLCFTVSFLFLQTLIFNILPLGIIFLVLYYTNKKAIYDGLIAASIPALILFCSGLLLYKINGLELYWEQNWIFNQQLFKLFYSNSSSVIYDWSIPIITAGITSIFIIRKKLQIYWQIINILFISELIRLLLFPAIFPHYLIYLFIYAALLIAFGLKYIKIRKYFNIILICMILINFTTIYLTNNLSFIKIYREINKKPENTVLNISHNFVNIYAAKTSYYSIVSNNLIMLDYYLFQRFPQYDINEQILEHNYKYLDFSQKNNCFLTKDECLRYTISDDSIKLYKKIEKGLYELINNKN